MGYEKMSTALLPALEDFPKIENTEEVTRQINRYFEPYIFCERHKDEIELWRSCCLRHEFIYNPPRMETPEISEVLYGRHNEPCICPYCGARATYKNARKLGKKARLVQYLPVVILKEKDGDIYARAYWTRKTYDRLDGEPEFYLAEAYHFTPGQATIWYNADERPFPRSISGNYDPQHRVITEPFTKGCWLFFQYEPYAVIGLDEIKKSKFKYCGYERFEKGYPAQWGLETVRLRSNMMKFFAAASIYPRQIEMLLKTGFEQIVYDLVAGRRKNRDIFDWKKDNYLDALGLSKTELRQWRDSGADIRTIAAYKKLRRAGVPESFENLKEISKHLNLNYTTDDTEFYRLCCRMKVKPGKMFNYLSRGKPTIPSGALTEYKDYIDMAKMLGWDLENDTVKLPKDLRRKHDEAAEEINEMVANETAAVSNSSILKRCAKYNFDMGDYCIRCAISAAEITAEGKALEHCVAGYAQRHMTNRLTILFLRRKDTPNKSLYTIEMHGSDLIQIHGYRNDRNSANPRETMAWLLDPWLDWVKTGSKRDKEGRPKMPKKKEAKTA